LKAVLRLPMLFALLGLSLSLSAAPDAVTLLQNGRANEALQVLNAQVRDHPNDARAYNLMCRSYYEVEQWPEAIRAAEKSLMLDSQNSEYHQWLARSDGRKAESAGVFAAISLVRKVKAEFEKAVALDPAGKNLSARADLAEFYIEAPFIMGGDKAKARRLADFVMNHDPALAHYIRGELTEKQNAKGEAEREYKAAVEASGNQAHYWVMLAAFYRRSGRLDEMQATVARSLSAPQKDGLALFDGAQVLLAGGRNFPEATRMFREYLAGNDLAEDGPALEAHYLLGLLLEKQGDPKSAAGEYRAALALGSNYRPAQDALARVVGCARC
jgi:tetratricopeptide (TPR) repeat protein